MKPYLLPGLIATALLALPVAADKPSQADAQPQVKAQTETKLKNQAKPQAEAMAHSAKVNINTASVDELQGLKGIGEVKAKAIIAYREKHGNFKSAQELANVSGIGPKLIEQNMGMILF
ncbi:ComEA family DNA-binding protein [Shewanella salipaludis]|uniref:Helix-hairpin-helix domain-containing protein n=1 Tax=Shewanella salipaludis TaxID=2723052 RepID=A0A972FSH6_9GAMM|nr:helix-hairpin-helix domain-containing protein [Shewanella salipaludis]NMH64429.1 helix-hairpin-helix domain-containing protein [Shewanella salipaludis]